MLGVAVLDTVTGTTVPVLGSFAALPAAVAEPDVIEVPAPPAVPGTCLTWTRPDAADTAVVDCNEPHLFEQAGAVELSDQAQLPDDGTWRQLVNERCTPVVVSYLNGKFDPNGKFRVGALKPSPSRWAQGDRQLRCGLQSASRSGALYPIVGKVADQDQSAVHEPGTCLGINGRTIGDPVDCSQTHAVETVGIVDLSKKFSDAFPPVEEQDKYLQPECTRIAAEYAGGPGVVESKKLTVYWDNVTESSWAAGARRVNCNLAALLPDRSGFAPITGSVRGAVSVGDTPAPPATNTPDPGVPAPPTTPATDPSATTPTTAPQTGGPSEGPQSTAPPSSGPTPTEVPQPPEQTPPAPPEPNPPNPATP